MFNGLNNRYRLDFNSKSGSVWIYIRSYIPSHPLRFFVVTFHIQAIPFEFNLRRNGFFYALIRFQQYFLDFISDIIDHYFNVYDNHTVMYDVKLEPFHTLLSAFMDSHNYTSLR